MRIVADDKIPFLAGVLEPFAEVIYLPGRSIDRKALRDADALLTRTRTKCNAATLEDTRVKFIGTATIGYDHIDTWFCKSAGIYWTNAPGCNSSSVCQYVASSLFKIASHDGFELGGKTLGIIGVGNVGSKVEKLARLLGMNVLMNDPPRQRVEGPEGWTRLEELLSSSDIVTVHVPLNRDGEDKTLHLFTSELFSRMKPGSWFINSSRGEVADNQAVKDALSQGIIAGAVIDVWENEPDIDIDLMNMSLISTPHIAGYSTDGKANGTAIVVNALAAFFGLPFSGWYPSKLPAPGNPAIEIDCTGKAIEEIQKLAVLHTYDVSGDSERLRSSPADFEKQRGAYPVRREFGAYTAVLKNQSGEAGLLLKEMGFNVRD